MDHVYYKRADSREWHGPATVLGQDEHQVFIKNGCSYIRDCPCQLQLMPPTQFHTDKPEMIIVVAHSPRSIR